MSITLSLRLILILSNILSLFYPEIIGIIQRY